MYIRAYIRTYTHTGPERNLGALDLMVWKPLGLAGPTLIEKAGAVKTEEALR